MDLDLFAARSRNPNCRGGVEDFLNQGERAARGAKTIWINPPWNFYAWLGPWIEEKLSGKKLAVLAPQWWTQTVQNWKVDWQDIIRLPHDAPAWFRWPEGQDRATPGWKCYLFLGKVR